MIDIGYPGDALHALASSIRWGLGWRYLFSATFRAEVHADWKGRNPWLIAYVVVTGVLFFALIHGVLACLVIAALSYEKNAPSDDPTAISEASPAASSANAETVEPLSPAGPRRDSVVFKRAAPPDNQSR